MAVPLVGADGGTATVRVAAAERAVPLALVNTARNCLPESASAPVPSYVAPDAPAMSVNVAPWSVDTCHCWAGAG